jgi:hypothetical protein
MSVLWAVVKTRTVCERACPCGRRRARSHLRRGERSHRGYEQGSKELTASSDHAPQSIGSGGARAAHGPGISAGRPVEDPRDHRRLLDQRQQTQAPAAAWARQHVEPAAFAQRASACLVGALAETGSSGASDPPRAARWLVARPPHPTRQLRSQPCHLSRRPPDGGPRHAATPPAAPARHDTESG